MTGKPIRKWAILVDHGSEAVITHFDDKDLAMKAAEKLSSQFPGSEVHLLGTVQVCRHVTPVQWRNCV